jgi:hypothetical protein
MMRGFKNLVKKNKQEPYVHVSLPFTRASRKRNTMSLRVVKPTNNAARRRIAAIAIRAHTLKKARAVTLNMRMNRPGSVLGQEPNWHGPRKLLNQLTRTGVKIGAQSLHGVVKRLRIGTVDNRYVIKTVKFRQQKVLLKEQAKLQWFRQEVAVGQMPGIENVGPRIHAWRLRPDGAEYVMDNVEMGDPLAKTYSFYQVNRKYPGAFYGAVAQVLHNFHVVTRGQHGDLHGENILFVKRGPRFDVRIIDYGSWKSDRVTHMVPIVTNSNVQAYKLNNGRIFRKNENMLGHLVRG